MPTIIDSLIVKLGLDSGDLNAKSGAAGRKLKDLEGQSEKAAGGVKKVGTTAKQSASGVETLTKSLGSFLALIGGTMAIRRFISDQIESNAQLDRFARNLGMSVSTVSAWGNAVEEMGGSAKGLQGSLDMLSKAQTELRLTGQSALIPYFSALGVSLATVSGQAKPVDEILLDLADRFSKMDRTTANNMGRMMGIDQDTLNLLLQGRHEVELTIKRQKEYNAVSKEQADEAVKLQRSIVQLKQGFEAFGRDLLQQAAPALEKVLGVLSEFGGWVRANREFVTDFLTVMAAALGAMAVAALPLTGTVAAVTALGAALAALYQDYQTWKRGGDSFVDWGVWTERVEAVTAAIHKLRGEISNLATEANDKLKKIPGFAKMEGWLTNGGARTAAKGAGNAAASALGINTSGGATVSGQARAQADRVSKLTGIPADILYAQWAHETGGFTNRGAKDLHNLAGVNVPGGKGQDYRNFKSFDEFGNYYAYLMRDGGRYAGASKAKTPEEFAAILKAGGYYADSQTNYASDMRRYFDGIPGASSGVAAAGSPSSPAGADNSITNHVGEIKVYTAATDAQGIARDMGKSMDFLFTSQANAGLN